MLFLYWSTILPLQAQIDGAGSSVFHFLDLPVSSRLGALGGENVSISDGDISMAFINPALLTANTDKVLQLNYAYYLAGTMFGSAMYGHNYQNNYFAAGVHYLDYGRMSYADENGTLRPSTFTAKDICINLMYARQLGPLFRVGVTLKPIVSVYESYTSFALGADVGGYFQTADTAFQMGLALRNIGWQLKTFYEDDFGQHTEMLPLNLELGLSYRLKHAPIRLSLTMHNLQRWDIAPMESEVKWYDMLFRHTIWAVDIVPRSERYYITVSYNHRRQAEMNLTNIKSLAGISLGAGVKIYKFRSMYIDAEERKKELMEKNQMSGLMFKMDDDPRITKVGKFIRKTSIDETPQFFNIFLGDMSLVGTRPPTEDEFKQYKARYKKRLSMKPGITGLWQVSGRSKITDFEEVVKLDTEYITNWSMGLDMRILFKTVAVVLGRDGSM